MLMDVPVDKSGECIKPTWARSTLVTDYEPDKKGDRDCDCEYTGNPLRYCAGANCL